jgi:transcriptional regulator with XRE-family HTH domain
MTGPELRAWRALHGMSQAQLAKRLGMSRPRLTEWEQGVTYGTKAPATIPPWVPLALRGIECEIAEGAE